MMVGQALFDLGLLEKWQECNSEAKTIIQLVGINMKKQGRSSHCGEATTSYSNPTIAEALCEIHFYSKVDYDNNLLQAVKGRLDKNYPGFAEQRIKQYRTEINESGISVEENQSNLTRWIFRHKDRNSLIQIHPGVITVNQVGSYPGWNVFKSDILSGWKAINDTFPIATMKRVGLRYINLIPKSLNEPLSEWLGDTPYFPEAILDNKTGFLSRSEIRLSTNVKLVVNIAEHLDGEGVLFDLDVISVAQDHQEFVELLDGIHSSLFDVFAASLTGKYKSFLKRKL